MRVQSRRIATLGMNQCSECESRERLAHGLAVAVCYRVFSRLLICELWKLDAPNRGSTAIAMPALFLLAS